MSDLGQLAQKIKKHEDPSSHKNACSDLRTSFGKIKIRQQLSGAYCENVDRYKDRVRKNRYVLSKIIDYINFAANLSWLMF